MIDPKYCSTHRLERRQRTESCCFLSIEPLPRELPDQVILNTPPQSQFPLSFPDSGPHRTLDRRLTAQRLHVEPSFEATTWLPHRSSVQWHERHPHGPVQ